MGKTYLVESLTHSLTVKADTKVQIERKTHKTYPFLFLVHCHLQLELDGTIYGLHLHAY
jgi:hypothetical protein